MNMQIDKKISTGTIITIIVIIFGFAMTLGERDTDLTHIEEKLNQKADKNVVDVQFQFVQQELKEIKEMLKELK